MHCVGLLGTILVHFLTGAGTRFVTPLAPVYTHKYGEPHAHSRQDVHTLGYVDDVASAIGLESGISFSELMLLSPD